MTTTDTTTPDGDEDEYPEQVNRQWDVACRLAVVLLDAARSSGLLAEARACDLVLERCADDDVWTARAGIEALRTITVRVA